MTRESRILLSCFDAMPVLTRPWKPLVVPLTTSVNTMGKMGLRSSTAEGLELHGFKGAVFLVRASLPIHGIT